VRENTPKLGVLHPMQDLVHQALLGQSLEHFDQECPMLDRSAKTTLEKCDDRK
jgi:hypothetical protein